MALLAKKNTTKTLKGNSKSETKRKEYRMFEPNPNYGDKKFDSTFNASRKAGQKTFEYNGKKYNTLTPKETNKGQTSQQILRKGVENSVNDAKSRDFGSPTHNRIADANIDEYWKVRGKEIKPYYDSLNTAKRKEADAKRKYEATFKAEKKADSTKLAKLGMPTSKSYIGKDSGKTTTVKTKILTKK